VNEKVTQSILTFTPNSSRLCEGIQEALNKGLKGGEEFSLWLIRQSP